MTVFFNDVVQTSSYTNPRAFSRVLNFRKYIVFNHDERYN